MQISNNQISIGLIKFLGIVVSIILLTTGSTTAILERFVVSKDKEKINDLNQNITNLIIEKNNLENRITVFNSQCDEKWNKVIRSNKEAFDKETNILLNKAKTEFLEKKIESDETVKNKVLSLNKEIELLKGKIKIQNNNNKVMAELANLDIKKKDLIRQINEIDSNLRELNTVIASWEVACVDLDKLPPGWQIRNEEEYWNACKMKKQYKMEHERLNNVLNLIKADIESVNNQRSTLYNRLNLL